MKKQTKIILGIVVLIIFAFAIKFNFPLSFADGLAPTLDMNAEGFYQYSGTPTISYLDGTVGCVMFPVNMYFGKYIVSGVSSIKTLNHNYKFEITDVQKATSPLFTGSCGSSNPIYTAKVYDNYNLIDTISFSSPNSCSGFKTRFEKEYPEIKVTFNELSVQGGRIGNRCGDVLSNEVLMVSKYELNYPKDTVLFNVSSIIKTSDNIKIILDVQTKGDYLAEISLATKDFLGNLNKFDTKNININQRSSITFEVPSSENIEIVPIAKLYSVSSDVSNLNGVRIWKPPIKTISNFYVTNEPLVSGYDYYKIGEFVGQEIKININETQIIQEASPQSPIVYNPGIESPPIELPKGGFFSFLRGINQAITDFFKKIFKL